MADHELEVVAVLNVHTRDLATAVRVLESLSRTLATYAVEGVRGNVSVEQWRRDEDDDDDDTADDEQADA